MIRTLCFTLAATLLAASSAQAGIVYAPATLANTDNAAGGIDTTWADGDDGSTGGTVADGTALNDGKWRYRGALTDIGNVWEATGSDGAREDTVELVTTATSLPNGTYNVYVFYFDGQGAADYNIRAGLASNPGNNPAFGDDSPGTEPGLAYTATAGTLASTLTFNNAPPSFGSALRGQLYSASIGPAVVTGGTLSVYVDDLPANQFAANWQRARSWYDGIGYERTGPVPEPATWVLSMVGAVGALLTARRRGQAAN